MKRFFCVMLFVVCLMTFGACTVEVASAEVIEILEFLGGKFNAFVEYCRPYYETVVANVGGFISGVMGK